MISNHFGEGSTALWSRGLDQFSRAAIPWLGLVLRADSDSGSNLKDFYGPPVRYVGLTASCCLLSYGDLFLTLGVFPSSRVFC